MLKAHDLPGHCARTSGERGGEAAPLEIGLSFYPLLHPINPTQPLVTENMPLAPPLSCFVCHSKSQCSNQHTGSGSFQG